jgi:hypothetical protein
VDGDYDMVWLSRSSLKRMNQQVVAAYLMAEVSFSGRVQLLEQEEWFGIRYREKKKLKTEAAMAYDDALTAVTEVAVAAQAAGSGSRSLLWSSIEAAE